MPPQADSTTRDFDRHFRRLTWLGLGLILIAGAILYAEKASDSRSAFVRWRPQVLAFWGGTNIYERLFPNPPIVPILLGPLMTLPPVTGAMVWFGFKVALLILSVLMCFRMVRQRDRPLPSWFQAGVLFFCLRPLLGDLHHGNNNIVILFLILGALTAWRQGHDRLAGLVLALAIAFKVTPALFLPYFLYKKSYRMVGATLVGLVLYLLVVPSLIVGPRFNGLCLGTWYQAMLSPYLMEGASSPQEFNQSMVGVLTRLLTDTKVGGGAYQVHLDLNLVSWAPATTRWLIKGVSAGVILLLAFFCRTDSRRRDDPRLLGEFALIVLAMLFLSERSWKHHFVTLLLPYTYLMAEFTYGTRRLGPRLGIAASMWASVLFMATTSTEIGGQFAGGQGHKIAQGYGMFLWAAVLLFVATAWRLRAPREAIAAVPRVLPPSPIPPYVPASREREREPVEQLVSS